MPRGFQIHLSTMIFLALLIGALLGANVTKRWELILSQGGDAYGWPEPFYFEAGMRERLWRFDPTALIFDIIYWLLVLWIFSVLWRHRALFRQFRISTWFSILLVSMLLIWLNLSSDDSIGWPVGWSYLQHHNHEWSEINYHALGNSVVTCMILLFFIGSVYHRLLGPRRQSEFLPEKGADRDVR